jgi:hypothetical protein
MLTKNPTAVPRWLGNNQVITGKLAFVGKPRPDDDNKAYVVIEVTAPELPPIIDKQGRETHARLSVKLGWAASEVFWAHYLTSFYDGDVVHVYIKSAASLAQDIEQGLGKLGSFALEGIDFHVEPVVN